MPISFTPAQRAAVEYSRGNLLLSAAAGSGKTAALTSRIARLLTSGDAELSEMLVVTYTRAAAAEMRERIGRRLREALDAARQSGDERTASLSARALAALPAARVSTIHAFLYGAMRPYFPALGLSPDARILDERTIDTLRAEIMRDTVDDAFRAGDEPTDDCASFPELCDILGQARDADAVDGELLWLDRKLAASGGDPGTLVSFADALSALSSGADFLTTPFGGEVRRAALAFARHYGRVFSDLAEDLEPSPAVWKRYGPICSSHLEALRRILDTARAEDASYDRLRAAVQSVTFEKLPSIPKAEVCDTTEMFRYFRDSLKKEHAGLAKALFSSSGDDAVQSAALTARILRRAAAVLTDFDARLAARKRDLAALDYGDLETGALRLFLDADGRRTRAAEEIGGTFKYIFIDEYQDTNDVQDRIFRALSPAASRFMVGDIKQSIYRFRGADPSVFTAYREKWPVLSPEEALADGPAYLEDEGRSLFMSENFRSAAPVVAFANAVSRHLLPYGEIDFREDGDLLVHARGDDPADPPETELVLIEKKRKKPGEESEEEAPSADPEVEYVAGRIAAMIGKYMGGSVLKPEEVGILLRSNRSAALYRDALAARGIPAATKTVSPLGQSPAVLLLVCLLNFVDNPLRDVYTAGALRSPVFSIDLGMMIRIREAAGDLPLWTGAVTIAGHPEDYDAPLVEACRKAAAWLARHKRIAHSLPADRYLEILLGDTDFFSLPGIRENGAERDALNRFSSAARAYENGVGAKIGGVSGFLDSVGELLDAPDDAGGGVKAKDAVSILSIHASKGLEFRVCFVCECAKRRNEEDERRTVLYDPTLGFGMTLPDPGGLARCDTPLRQALASKIARESVSEEMRMLYVALTRARDRLIVTGKTPDPDRTLAEAAFEAAFADGYRAEQAGSYLAWMCEAIEATHAQAKVTVIPEEPEKADNTNESAPEAFVPEQISMFPAEPEEPEDKGPSEEELRQQAEDAALLEEVRRRFAWQYEDDGLRRVPAKLTVSRLSPEILDADEDRTLSLSLDEEPEAEISDESGNIEEPAKPALAHPTFMTGGRQATPAERGSATHVFLQFVDHRRLREDGVRAEIGRLVRERYLSEASASLLYVPQLERFRDSALLDALLRSPMVKREFRFNALLPAERFTKDEAFAGLLRARGIRVTVQGVVDCVYRDPDTGRLILVDYKTDRLTSAEMRDPSLAAEKLRARHTRQLSYYREICSAMFEEEIAAARVYSTALGKCVEI
ncbi:MAG: UvrD-helicase domain-containing protein [Clostridia bacterium]|nr:UvrD-helicase domain-containing protein [Clostridia bacterium]